MLVKIRTLSARRSSRTVVLAVSVLVVSAACSGAQDTKNVSAKGKSPTTVTSTALTAGTPTPGDPTGVGSDRAGTGTDGAAADSGAAPGASGGSPPHGTPSPGGGNPSSPGGGNPDGDQGVQGGGGGRDTSPPPPPEKNNRHYPPGGPVDDVFPPGTPAYDLLAEGRCADLLGGIDKGTGPHRDRAQGGKWPPDEPATHLYRAAAQACLGQWAGAEQDFAAIDPASDNPFSCLDAGCSAARQFVYDWTAELLKAHEADPTFVPEFEAP